MQVHRRLILLLKILWMELMATGGRRIPSGLVLPLAVIEHVTLGKVLDFLEL